MTPEERSAELEASTLNVTMVQYQISERKGTWPVRTAL